MKLLNMSNSDLHKGVHSIIRQLNADRFNPDYIVGITRGGLIPAIMLSHYLNIPMHTLAVSLLEGNDTTCESNLWMSEDAIGYVPEDVRQTEKSRWDVARRKKILIIDDINDTGKTIKWIKQDWQSSCFPNEQYAWDTIWGHNVKFATLINNEASDFKDVDYTSMFINKVEDPQWIKFPWENWWES